jgi:hypothetical protein
MKHPNQTKGIAGTSRAPAQDLTRYTARAAANHLSPAEQKVHLERTLDRDVEALKLIQARRLSKPPHQHRYVAGACKVCGVEQAGGAA